MRFPDGARACTSVPPPAPDPITIKSYAFDMPPPPPSSRMGLRSLRACNALAIPETSNWKGASDAGRRARSQGAPSRPATGRGAARWRRARVPGPGRTAAGGGGRLGPWGREHRRDDGGRGAGRLGGSAGRNRPVRGPIGAALVDLRHRRQPGTDSGDPRPARRPALGAGARRWRAGRGRVRVPARIAPALGRPLGKVSGSVAGGAAPFPGNARARARCHRSPAARPARCDPAPGRGRMELGRGARGALRQRSESARAAAPRAFSRAPRDRPLRRPEIQAMSRALPADLDCVVAVEQVTDYLEGALPLQARTEFEQHLVTCPGCLIYLRQSRAQIAASASLADERPAPEEVTRKLLAMFRASRGI